MEAKLEAGSWDGYPGGDAPGFSFETLEWIQRNEIAAIASDTWGCEVRPNESEPGINQPWHWITIPIMGLTMGEIFYLADLSQDCAQDACMSSCSSRRPFRLPGRSARRPTRWRSSERSLAPLIPAEAGIEPVRQIV